MTASHDRILKESELREQASLFATAKIEKILNTGEELQKGPEMPGLFETPTDPGHVPERSISSSSKRQSGFA
jgi:hypothetical protein